MCDLICRNQPAVIYRAAYPQSTSLVLLTLAAINLLAQFAVQLAVLSVHLQRPALYH